MNEENKTKMEKIFEETYGVSPYYIGRLSDEIKMKCAERAFNKSAYRFRIRQEMRNDVLQSAYLAAVSVKLDDSRQAVAQIKYIKKAVDWAIKSVLYKERLYRPGKRAKKLTLAPSDHDGIEGAYVYEEKTDSISDLIEQEWAEYITQIARSVIRTPAEEYVFTEHCGGKTFAEISEQMNISRMRACQYWLKIIKRTKEQLNKKGIV